jgi:PPP family 3-phenylpropionic acid transporter
LKVSQANRLRIIYFLVFCCTASWLPILAEYLKDHGLTGIKIGIVLSVTPCMMFLVQPFYGMLADRLGYKKCLLLSSAMAAVSYTFYLFQGGFVYLFAITVFMSLFYNTIQPILDSLSLKLAKDNPKFSYGTLRIAGAAGWAFTGILAGYYIDMVNTSVIFVIAAVSMFLTFLFSFFISIGQERSINTEGQSFKNLGEVLANKTLIILLMAVFLVSAGATTIWNFYSIYMKENGASASWVGYGISFQGLCELPLFYFSARIIRKFGLRTTLLITIFTTAFRMFLYSIVKNPHTAVFIEVLHGISWSLFWVVCVEYVNMLVREDWRVTGQSLLYAAYYGAGAIVGNFWTGYLYDSHMKISGIFSLNAGIVSIVGILFFFAMRRKRPAEVGKGKE